MLRATQVPLKIDLDFISTGLSPSMAELSNSVPLTLTIFFPSTSNPNDVLGRLHD